jgi:hypothetical protein
MILREGKLGVLGGHHGVDSLGLDWSKPPGGRHHTHPSPDLKNNKTVIL